ncbi:hypothetical protein ACHAQE_011130 [Botrytis cinerea]
MPGQGSDKAYLSQFKNNDGGPKYDFTVATSLESINAGLREFLTVGNSPALRFCRFFTDEGVEYLMEWEDVLKITNNVDPFQIASKEGKAFKDDPTIQLLHDKGFSYGVMVQPGIPSCLSGRDFRNFAIVNFDSGIERVKFKLLFEDVIVVEDNAHVRAGKWTRWTQADEGDDDAWFVEADVNLTISALSDELDTPYFKNHPDERDKLMRQLNNISGTAYSLEQLYFDLNQTVLSPSSALKYLKSGEEVLPTGSAAQKAAVSAYKDGYEKIAKSQGEPLVTVTAVVQTKDASDLQMTAFERQISKLKDSNGSVIQNPTKLQKAAATLDYLCTTKPGAGPPSTNSFNWNWVTENEVSLKHGVVAINRNTIAKYFLKQLLDPKISDNSLRRFCVRIQPYWSNGGYGVPVAPFQEPDSAIVTDNGRTVIQVSYDYKGRADLDDSRLYFDSSYTCDVSFYDNIIEVKHVSKFWTDFSVWGSVGAGYFIWSESTESLSISVDSKGELYTQSNYDQVINDKHDHLEDTHDNVRGWRNGVLAQLYPFTPVLNVGSVNNFIFPAAQTFAFTKPLFSVHQDLVCDINYLSPSGQAVQSQWSQPQQRLLKVAARPSTIEAPKDSLAWSCEYIHNYVGGMRKMAPTTKQFLALQNEEGHGMVFELDSDGVLRVFLEKSGQADTPTGWQVADLSTTTLAARCPGGVVTRFDVAQSELDGSIGLMMAVRAADTDVLFTALHKSAYYTEWVDNPGWKKLEYDGTYQTTTGQIHQALTTKITISGTYFAEIGGGQYLVVDLNRPENGKPHIERYHIVDGDWVIHPIGLDVESDSYLSVVGRIKLSKAVEATERQVVSEAHGKAQAAGQKFAAKPKDRSSDGLYTLGRAGSSVQFEFRPLENDYSDIVPPTVRLLQCPGGGKMPSAITVARHNDWEKDLDRYAFTDVYIVVDDTLYRLDNAAQMSKTDRSVAICTNDLLSQTTILLGTVRHGITTIWGRNEAGDVFYVACEVENLQNPNSWSVPIPILRKTTNIATYANRVDGGNTIYAALEDGTFQRLTQDPLVSKLWRADGMQIPAREDVITPSTPITSVTTTVRISSSPGAKPPTGKNTGKSTVYLRASSRTPVYVNGIYHVLEALKTSEVLTDPLGVLTIVEETPDMSAAILTVSLDNFQTQTIIDPTQVAFEKLTSLQTSDELKKAKVYRNPIAGGIRSDSKQDLLIPNGTNADDVDVIAKSLALIASCRQTFGIIPGAAAPSLRQNQNYQIVGSGSDNQRSRLSKDNIANFAWWNPLDLIPSSVGDLIRGLLNGVGKLAGLVFDAASNVYHLVVKVGKLVYQAVLDTAEACVKAVVWLFDKVAGAVEDAVRYIRLLLEWDDIENTKDVFHHFTLLFLKHQVDRIPKLQKVIDDKILAMEKKVAGWAGIEGPKNNWSGLGEAGNQTTAGGSSSDPNEGQTSLSRTLSSAFSNNVGSLAIIGDGPSMSEAKSLITILLDAISSEGEVLGAVIGQLKTLAEDFSSLKLADILKRLVGIIVNGVMGSAKVVINALLNVLQSIASTLVQLLDTKIYIPVVSDILGKLGYQGFSFLDLFTWIAATGYTIVFKITHGKAPFTSGESKTITGAIDWNALKGVVNSVSTTGENIVSKTGAGLKIAAIGMGALLKVLTAFVAPLEAETTSGDTPVSTAKMILDVLAGGTISGVSMLVPSNPIKDEIVSNISEAVSGIELLVSLMFSKKVQAQLGKVGGTGVKNLQASNGRGVAAIIKAVLVIPKLFCTVWHTNELAALEDSADKTADILGRVAEITGFLITVTYAIAVNDKDKESQQIFVIALGVENFVLAGVLAYEAGKLASKGVSSAIATRMIKESAAIGGAHGFHIEELVFKSNK